MMKFLQRALVAIGLVATAGSLAALADYVIKDGAGASQTVKAFVCETTKICPASVPITSAGVEIAVATAAAQATTNTKLDTVIANQATELAAIQAPVPAGTNAIGFTSNDPCTNKTKVNLPINQNGTSSVQLIALSGSTVIYVCSIMLMTNSAATTVAITTGTGTACVTGNAAVLGSTTANIANSMNLLAGAGFTLGGGYGTVARGAAAGELCMILGTNVFVSGNLTYVQE